MYPLCCTLLKRDFGDWRQYMNTKISLMQGASLNGNKRRRYNTSLKQKKYQNERTAVSSAHKRSA